MAQPLSLKVALVQECWTDCIQTHQDRLATQIFAASKQGAQLVCLQELTLSPYFCTQPHIDSKAFQEDLYTGPTFQFVSHCAQEANLFITASLFESPGYNTAIAVNPLGQLIGYTRKQHIPSGEKYHEDHYFKPGNSDYPLHHIADHAVALPTCYDQWFPELSRIYSLKGAELIIYPTAIGSEPTAPEFDSQPLWQSVIVAQGITANTFMIAVNRVGCEDGLTFYGSSFISTPLGEVIAQAPRNEPALLVAELDFSKRDLWGRLFPFNHQRQPTTYQTLVTTKETI